MFPSVVRRVGVMSARWKMIGNNAGTPYACAPHATNMCIHYVTCTCISKYNPYNIHTIVKKNMMLHTLFVAEADEINVNCNVT